MDHDDMGKSITLELPERVDAALEEFTREEGILPAEVVIKAIDDYLFVRKFRRLREQMMAESGRVYTEEEIFEAVS